MSNYTRLFSSVVFANQWNFVIVYSQYSRTFVLTFCLTFSILSGRNTLWTNSWAFYRACCAFLTRAKIVRLREKHLCPFERVRHFGLLIAQGGTWYNAPRCITDNRMFIRNTSHLYPHQHTFTLVRFEKTYLQIEKKIINQICWKLSSDESFHSTYHQKLNKLVAPARYTILYATTNSWLGTASFFFHFCRCLLRRI